MIAKLTMDKYETLTGVDLVYKESVAGGKMYKTEEDVKVHLHDSGYVSVGDELLPPHKVVKITEHKEE